MPHPYNRGRKREIIIERPAKPRQVPGIYYSDVPKLGNVAVSRHAQDRMAEFCISQEIFDRVLLEPVKEDIREPEGILWRERDGIRIVIIEKPEPFRGAKLVKTVYKIQGQRTVKPS